MLQVGSLVRYACNLNLELRTNDYNITNLHNATISRYYFYKLKKIFIHGLLSNYTNYVTIERLQHFGFRIKYDTNSIYKIINLNNYYFKLDNSTGSEMLVYKKPDLKYAIFAFKMHGLVMKITKNFTLIRYASCLNIDLITDNYNIMGIKYMYFSKLCFYQFHLVFVHGLLKLSTFEHTIETLANLGFTMKLDKNYYKILNLNDFFFKFNVDSFDELLAFRKPNLLDPIFALNMDVMWLNINVKQSK